MNDIMSLLQTVGAKDSVFDGMDCSGIPDDLDFGNEIIAVLRECGAATNVTYSAQCLERARELAARRAESLHKYYNIVVAAIVAKHNLQPNAAFTLYGPDPDCGATYDCNEIIPLTPRSSNAVEGDFEFNGDQMFFALVTGEVDSNAGWRFQAGSVKFKGDVVSTMLKDVSFTVFEDKATERISPLSMYMYRWPSCNVPFSASAFHNNTAPTALVEGVTIHLLDRSCKNVSRSFGDSLFEFDFANAVGDLMRIHRGRCRRQWSFAASSAPSLLGR